MWKVVYLDGARAERSKLPGVERAAVDNAVKKLEALGPRAGAGFIIAAVAPDGQSDPRGFRQACDRALQRLAEVEEG